MGAKTLMQFWNTTLLAEGEREWPWTRRTKSLLHIAIVEQHRHTRTHILSQIKDYQGTCNHPDRNSIVWECTKLWLFVALLNCQVFHSKFLKFLKFFLLILWLLLLVAAGNNNISLRDNRVLSYDAHWGALTKKQITTINTAINMDHNGMTERGTEFSKVSLRVYVCVQKESFNFQLLYFELEKKKNGWCKEGYNGFVCGE